MTSPLFSCLVGCTLALATPSLAHAGPKAKEAESAYAAVDFSRTLELAKAALEEGHNEVRQTERLYFLLGIAHAALGNDSEATAAFTTMLAINPEARLERTLSPKLRGPYAQALGFWQSTSERLQATAAADTLRRQVEIGVSDPTDCVRWLAVSSRKVGGGYARKLIPVSEIHQFQVPLPSNQTSEYMITLLDEHQNKLFSLGSPGKPLTFALSAGTPSANALAPTPGGSSLGLVGGALMALGAASVGTAIPFHVDREKQAKDWNGPGCEAPTGLARDEQCAGVKKSLDQAEQRALLLYATGGVLLTGGFVTWLLAPDSRPSEQAGPHTAVSCQAGFASIHCRATF